MGLVCRRVLTALLLWRIDAGIASFTASERPAFSQWVTKMERIRVGPILFPVHNAFHIGCPGASSIGSSPLTRSGGKASAQPVRAHLR